MGTFTMPLKRAIEVTGGTTQIVNGVTKLIGGNIGIQYYPIFKEEYRDHLTGIIIDHFWNREIGMETVSMFQLAMRRKMNEIMPLYNKLYNSELIAFDPLSTVDLNTINNMTSNQATDSSSDSTNSSDNDSDSLATSYDTPSTVLSGSKDYASGAAGSESHSNVVGAGQETANTNVDSIQTSDSTTKGYQGSASALLSAFRDTLLNIDLMIVQDLEDLFMSVWDNGDSYTNERFYF